MGQRRNDTSGARDFVVDHHRGGQQRADGPRGREFVVDHPDRRVARVAARQGGAISRPQLVSLGVTRRAIERRIESGRLTCVHRGVYAVGHAALSPRGELFAALLAIGPDAVLSHRTAAWMWQLADRPPAVELSIPGRRLRPRPGLAPHSVAPYLTSEVRRRDGLPLTAPLRTITDLAATADQATLERAIREARVLGLVTDRELERAARGRLARLLDTRGTQPTRSRLERAMLRLAERAGLPRPATNVRVGPYLVDFLWPRQRVIVETDGWAAHGHRAAFEADRARDAALQALGYVVVRFTWRQLTDEPALVAARLAATLAAREPGAPG
jgi:very-short-patch-repair endonuclease